MRSRSRAPAGCERTSLRSCQGVVLAVRCVFACRRRVTTSCGTSRTSDRNNRWPGRLPRPVVDLRRSGAGGNRTLVRQAVIALATTIPECAPLRLVHRRVDYRRSGTGSSFRAVSGLCLRSAVSPAVHRYFCCRAVAIRPRVPLLVAMSLRSLKSQAARAKSPSALLLVPRFRSLSNSGRTNDFRSQRRNRSAPCQGASLPGGSRSSVAPPRADSAGSSGRQ
jgi:hypothetical protein